MSIRDEIHLGLLDQRALTGRLGRHAWNHSQRQEKGFLHEAMVHSGGIKLDRTPATSGSHGEITAPEAKWKIEQEYSLRSGILDATFTQNSDSHLFHISTCTLESPALNSALGAYGNIQPPRQGLFRRSHLLDLIPR
jgi:hypothetical protein